MNDQVFTMTLSTKNLATENDSEKESFQDASEGTPKTSQAEPSDEQASGKENEEVDTTKDTKDTKVDKSPKEPDVDPGMDLSAKELYRRERYEEWREWEGELPDDDNEKYKKHAIVVRRERDTDGGGVVLHSVNVQSPFIRAFLGKVFDGYRGVYTNLKRLVLRPPFREFFHRWDRFNQLFNEINDEVTRKHVELLKNVIAPEIKPHLEAQEDLIKHGVISYEYLWALFPPDTEVYAQTGSGERLFLARRCWYRKNRVSTTFIVDCEFIDFDGTILGYAMERLEVEQFGGHLPISEINPVPTAFVPGLQDIRHKLAKRGQAVEKLMGVHYKGYSGLYEPAIGDGIFKPRRRYIDQGRIVVDAKLFHEQDPDRKPRIRPLGVDVQEKEKSDDDYDYYDNTFDDIEDDHYGDSNTKPGRMTLTDEEYCYCSPFVKGYCLTSKKWGKYRQLGNSLILTFLSNL